MTTADPTPVEGSQEAVGRSVVSFTPGPWVVCYDGQIDAPDGSCICTFHWGSFKEFNETPNAANARLIAAAPELLNALQEFLDADEDAMAKVDGNDDQAGKACERALAAHDRARAAIARATGAA